MSEPEWSLITLMDDAVLTGGALPFLEYRDHRLTFQEAQREAAQIATLLVDQGIEPGDRVIIARNDPMTAIITLLGALRVGAVCTIADPAAPRFAAENILSDLAPFAVMADE